MQTVNTALAAECDMKDSQLQHMQKVVGIQCLCAHVWRTWRVADIAHHCSLAKTKLLHLSAGWLRSQRGVRQCSREASMAAESSGEVSCFCRPPLQELEEQEGKVFS